MNPNADGWEDAYAQAKDFVSQMTILEKVNLTTGVGCVQRSLGKNRHQNILQKRAWADLKITAGRVKSVWATLAPSRVLVSAPSACRTLPLVYVSQTGFLDFPRVRLQLLPGTVP